MRPQVPNNPMQNLSRGNGSGKVTCDNCLHCKLVPGTMTIRCTMGMWTYESSGEERRLTLLERELTRRLDHRKFFDQARKCEQFSSMEEEI